MRRILVLVAVMVTSLASPALAAQRPASMLGQDLTPQTAFPGASAEPPLTPTPRAQCDAASRPETGMQGRVPAGSDAGFACNFTQLSHEGRSGGFKVERFVDQAGRECAYYDTALVFPTNAVYLATQATGVAVLDMADPANPVRTATLRTPAMQSPHESLLLNQKRGLLAAVLGTPVTAPGIVDIYDLNADCRHPALQSSLPVGFLGHESGFAPDGLTFYATSLFNGSITAVDVTNPQLPSTLWIGQYSSHGLTLSDDGNRAYLAALGGGLTILDVSEIQARRPNPQARVVSRLSWGSLSIPQVALPVTFGGKPFLVEVDEFSTAIPGGLLPTIDGKYVGAARIIDISDELHPKVVSNLRLAVHQPENRATIAGDPSAISPAQGYAAHYCGVPQEHDPGIVACSFIASGLRVFDVRDPYQPKELGYFVAPPTLSIVTPQASDYAMSRPSFAPARGEIWYSDAGSGFYALKASKGVWPFEDKGPALGLPTARRCASRRSFAIHLHAPRGQRLRSARVFVNGKRVKVVKGRRLRARVNLRGLPKGTVRVRIVARTARGRRITETRRYRTCVKKR